MLSNFSTHMTLVTEHDNKITVPTYARIKGIYVPPQDHPNRRRICKYLMSQINNKTFAWQLWNDLKSGTDLIFESAEPQNGKTKLILIMTWLLKFYCEKLPVIIVDNSLTDITQFKERVTQFNQQIRQIVNDPNFELDIFEVDTRVSDKTIAKKIKELKPLLTTIHHTRYRRVIDILRLKAGRGVSFIFDEADQSVGSVADMTDLQKEQIFRQMIDEFGRDIQINYITATPFAVENSPHRTDTRSVIVRRVPNNMYEHKRLYYRGFDHETNQFTITECLTGLKDLSTCNPEDLSEFNTYILDILTRPVSPNQPNIALLNVSFENEPKQDLRQYIQSNFKGYSYRIAIYSGNSIEDYQNDNEVGVKYQVHIGRYLQIIKGSVVQQHASVAAQHVPIIILATNKAKRSQTYKSDDHGWKLTHFFLNLPPSSHGETIMQSLRGNGQYPPEAPGLRYYMSKDTYQRILFCYVNKECIAMNMQDPSNGHLSLRDKIIRTTLLQVSRSFKMSRKEVDDTKFEKNEIRCHGMFDSLDETQRYIESSCQLHQLNLVTHLVTEFHTIPRIEFQQAFGHIINLEVINPLVKLSQPLQSQLREWIKTQCYQRGWVGSLDSTCQIGYTKERCLQLNQLEINKKLNFRADIIAFDAELRGDIPVVIYPDRNNIPDTAIIIWHTTDQKVCFYINLPEQYIKWSSLKKPVE